MNNIKLKITAFCGLSYLVISSFSYAASPVNLRHERPMLLSQYLLANTRAALGSANGTQLKLINNQTDRNQITHSRLQETYAGIPVLGGDIVIHTPQGKGKKLTALVVDKQSKMNGVLYQNLEKDLTTTSMLNDQQKNKALDKAKQHYQTATKNKINTRDEFAEVMIYMTPDNIAHYVFITSFETYDNRTGLHRPTYIIDAATLTIYSSWDNMQAENVSMGDDTHQVESVGGFLNKKIFYDGKNEQGHAPYLMMQYQNNNCVFENNRFTFRNAYAGSPVLSNPCKMQGDNQTTLQMIIHDKDSLEGADSFNGAYSPASDAFYNVTVSDDLYQQWYGMHAYQNKNKKNAADKLPVIMHYETRLNPDGKNDTWVNAAFDPFKEVLKIGDGGDDVYPLVSLQILAHELSHAFTYEHSNLFYDKQSGAINESFSDMAASATEFFAEHKNTWTIGKDNLKSSNPSFTRYMDDPKKDGRSIDNVNDYTPLTNVHLASGIFNKAFYLLANKPGWNTKKAFDVMVAANQFYWTAYTSFYEGACGVLMAAKDAKNNNIPDIINVFEQVGINLNTDCNKPDSLPDNVPSCPYNVSLADLPCRETGSFDRFWVGINVTLEKETTSFTVTNTSISYLPAKLEITYYDCSAASPTEKTLEYPLARKAKQAVTINSNCVSKNVDDKMKKINVELLGKEQNLEMVLSST